MIGASSDLGKSLVIIWQNNGIAHVPDKRHCEREVEALNVQHAKTLVTPTVSVSESVDGESIRECSWESMRAPDSQSETASVPHVLDTDKTSLYRSAVARLNIVGGGQARRTVRCESMLPCRAQESLTCRHSSMGRYAKGCPDTGIVGRFIVQRNSHWARDKSTRKSVSAGNIRYGQHLLRSWEKQSRPLSRRALGKQSFMLHVWWHSKPWERRTWPESWECILTSRNCTSPMRPLESSVGRDWEK